MIIQIEQASILSRSIVLQLYKRLNKIIEEKCNTNAKQQNMYLNDKRGRIACNVIIYRYKNNL